MKEKQTEKQTNIQKAKLNKVHEKLKKVVSKCIKLHKYEITEKNLNVLVKKIYERLFKNYKNNFNSVKNLQNGGTLPSEYFGINSNSYVNSNAGTDMSSTNVAIRPELTSNVFPLEGGGCPCMIGGMSSKCKFFTITDIKLLKSQKIIDFDNKLLKENKEFINNKLNEILHNLMKNVKNKKKTNWGNSY